MSAFNQEQAQAELLDYLNQLQVQIVHAKEIIEEGEICESTPEEQAETQSGLVLDDEPMILGDFYIKRIVKRL